MKEEMIGAAHRMRLDAPPREFWRELDARHGSLFVVPKLFIVAVVVLVIIIASVALVLG